MIQTSKPLIGREECAAVEEVFKSGYLGYGDQSKEFESCLSTYLGRDAVGVSSGTSAIHLSLSALGIGTGDEVIVQSLTFLATYQAIEVTGAKPVPCDILPNDLRLDIADAERKLTNRTRAIIPVHYAGFPGIPEEIYEFARRNQLRVIEDAAHSFGGFYNGQKIGSYGDITCFSFDPVKTLTCGEGGAVVSGDKTVVNAIKELRMLGIRQDIKQTDLNIRANVYSMGWRNHLSNINGAIGVAQFRKLGKIIYKRQNLIHRYLERLCHKKYLDLFPYDYDSIVPYIFVVKLKHARSLSVIEEMKRRGIECINHYYPPHLQPYFFNKIGLHVKAVEEIYPFLLSLPLHAGLEVDDINNITRSLDDILNEQ